MKYVSCGLCGSDEHKLLLVISDTHFSEKAEYRLVRCTDCGFIFVNPMPSDVELQPYYSQAYGNYRDPHQPLTRFEKFTRWLQTGYMVQELGYGSPNNPSLIMARLMALFTGMKYRYFPHFRPRGRLLDVGCATGRQMEFFRQMGWDVYGVDTNQHATHLALQAGLSNVVTGTLEEAEYPAGFFDAVWIHHVLEHVPKPLPTLVEVHRILRSGGSVSLITPSIESWLFHQFGADWFALDVPRHLSHFSPDTIAKSLHTAGFQAAKAWTEWAQGDVQETLVRSMAGFTGRRILDYRMVLKSRLVFAGLLIAKPFCSLIGNGSVLKAIAWKGESPL